MPKMDLPEPTGKCTTCGINLYPPNNEPVKMPCNVGLFRENNLKAPDKKVCPFESPKEQLEYIKVGDHEKIAGLLGTQHGD